MAKRITARGLARHVDELYRVGYDVARKYREIAGVNEAFVHGSQWDAVVNERGRTTVRREQWDDKGGVPRIAVNETAPILMTWSSLMTKDLPSVAPVAASDEPEDTYKAQIGSLIIDFLIDELDSTNKVHKAVHFAGMHGLGGIKIVFLPEENKVDWSRLTVFDFVIDPSRADWRKARWVIFEDHADIDEAVSLFEARGIDKTPKEEPYKNAAGDELRGVRRLELWERPCRAYPKGLYVCVVDGEVVEQTDYPYVFQDDSGKPQYPLPLSLMRVRDVRDSVWGGTNLTDVVPLQRAFNEMVSRIQKLLRMTTNMHLKVPDSIPADWSLTESSLIKYKASQPNAAREIGWTQPGEPSRALFEQRDFFRAAMQTVMGLNEVTIGSETKSLSGRAIENIVELDAQKNADASKEMRAMVREAWALTWRLVGAFYTDMRKAKITNRPIADVFAFNMSDVQGMDVRLEPSSELDKLRPVKTSATKERIDQGIDPPGALGEAKNDPGQGLSRMHAEQLVQAFLAGQDIGLESADDIDPDVLEQVIQRHKARALSRRDMELWIRLERLRRDLAQMAPRADDAQPKGGQEAEGGPARGPGTPA